MKLNFKQGNRFTALRALVTQCINDGIAQEDCLTTVKVICQVIDFTEIDPETFVDAAYVATRNPVAFVLRVKVLKPCEAADFRRHVQEALGDDVLVEVISDD